MMGLGDRWKGLRDEQLSEVSGIPGCIFVHASGFTGGESAVSVPLFPSLMAVTLRMRNGC